MKTMKMVMATAVMLSMAAMAQAQGKPAPPTAPPKPTARVRTQLQGFDLSSNSGKSANQIGGASRDLGTPRLFAPPLAKAFLTHPNFNWEAADPGARVMFRLTSMNGQTIYEIATTASHLAYPADAPALEPGMTYRWTIIPENDMLGGAPQPVSFTIISGEERDAIRAELQNDPDAAGADVMMKHRIWYDALAGYNNRLLRNPEDQEARKGRASLYDQLPATYDLADADWKMVH